MLITGATDGLGRALAARAHGEGWRVLAHGRSDERLQALAAELDGVTVLRADLASLAEVAELVGAVEAATDRLDVVISNAGIGGSEPGGGARQESRDGHELRFAVNYLAGYVLIRGLLGLLRASAPARIVQVASAGQMPLDFGDVMLTRRLRRHTRVLPVQARPDHVRVRSRGRARRQRRDLHRTASRHVHADQDGARFGAQSADAARAGVDATWRLAADPALDGVTGTYFDGFRRARPDGQALDPDDRRALRELSEHLSATP